MEKLYGSQGTYSFVDEKRWPNAPIRMSGGIRILKDVPPEYVVPHIEDHHQLQIFLGQVDRADSMTAEVTLEDQKFERKSPLVAILPRGLKHSQRILNGSGWFFTVHFANRCLYYDEPVGHCPIEVGKEYEITVEEKSRQRQGVARIQGFVVFIPNTDIGDRAKVRINRIGQLSADAEIVE